MTERAQKINVRTSTTIPIASIRREVQPWHIRTSTRAEDVERLARAIENTKEVVPITVVQVGEGNYDYVTGLIRIQALERLGESHIPAIVLTTHDDEALLRTALAEQEVRFPLGTLERGWAITRLLVMRQERGLPAAQNRVAEELGLDRGDVSTAIRAARAIPFDRARELAREYDLELTQIAALPRTPLRAIARTEDVEERDRLIEAALSAVASGESPTRAVAEARELSGSGTRTGLSRVVTALSRIMGWVRRFTRVIRLRTRAWYQRLW